MIGNIGPMEIAIVLVIALVVFGPKRLPELGSGLGRGIREFKGSISGEAAAQPLAPESSGEAGRVDSPEAERERRD